MTPRTKEQNEAIRLRRKQQILQAAETVFASKGARLEIRDVAQAANLGYGTVYHYYNSKPLLIQDLLEHGFALAEEAAARLQPDTPFSLPGSPAIQAYFIALAGLWTEHPSVYLVYKSAAENFLLLDADQQQDRPERFRQNVYQPFADLVRRTFTASGSGDAAGPAERTASALLGAFIGAYGIYFHHGRADFDAEAVAAALTHGLAGGNTWSS